MVDRLVSQREESDVDLSDSPEQARYRETVRARVREHAGAAPAASGSSEDEAYIAARRKWQGTLAEAGLAGVTWPREYGGEGVGAVEHGLVNPENSAARGPGILHTTRGGLLR